MKQKLLVFFMLSVMLVGTAFAQSKTVTGTVTASDDGSPLPGVTVVVSGTNEGTQTDLNGKYSLTVPSNATSLTFSYIGFESQSVVVGNRTEVSIVLQNSASTLSEVVISAGGIEVQKKAQGYASTDIKADDLVTARPVNIASGLSGKVAGMRINATSGGVNPNYRVNLRGMRSLTGNNEALIVLDNIVVPNEVLGNLNPEDVANITVLNGAGASALYGSEASNGALIITTKRGQRGTTRVTLSNTSTFEQVAFYPDLQTSFGAGSDRDVQIYTPYENQQFGPRFDGSMREIGYILPDPDATLQSIPYAASNGKKDFWQDGYTNQTDLAVSTGSDRGTMYLSAQYADVEGTTPGDLFNRATVRFNGNYEMAKNLTASISSSYTQNNYDVTTSTAALYDQLLQTPANIPVTAYKDWRNNPFASPDGYYNAYYNNPYFTADNNRRNSRNEYVIGGVELKYAPLDWLDFTYRIGLTSRNYTSKEFQDIYRYSPFTHSQAQASTYKVQDIAGSTYEGSMSTTRVNSDFMAGFKKDVEDFTFRLTVGAAIRQDQTRSASAEVLGLVVPGLFNLGNSTTPPTAEESNYKARQLGLYGDLNVGFRDYLFLHVTGRNDWISTLPLNNNSFFYPAADVSFVATDAIESLQDIEAIDFIKLRAGVSKTGNVNLGNRSQFGAYKLDPTFGQGAGYPYSGTGGFTIDNTMVAANLNPEITRGYEFGFDANFWSNRIQTKFTYFDNQTTDQTVQTGVSSTTGFSTYLLNAAKTSSKGIETSLRVVPVRTQDWEVSIGGNYSHYDNKVLEVSDDADQLQLGAYGSGAGSYAVKGQPFPVIMGTTHERDDQGRIIVDPTSGYPTETQNISVLGNAAPKHILGVDLGIAWKNLYLSALAEYRGGYDYFFAGSTIDFSGSSIATTYYDRDRFVIPNSSYMDESGNYVPNTNITVRDGGPGFWTMAGTRTGIDENYVISGAFWKLREVSLSYDLPVEFLARSQFIEGARISLQGRNLFMLTPKTNIYTDPEYSDGDGLNNGNAIGLANLGQTPPSRYFGLTVSLTF